MACKLDKREDSHDQSMVKLHARVRNRCFQQDKVQIIVLGCALCE